jgi:hypothetical protein
VTCYVVEDELIRLLDKVGHCREGGEGVRWTFFLGGGGEVG